MDRVGFVHDGETLSYLPTLQFSLDEPYLLLIDDKVDKSRDIRVLNNIAEANDRDWKALNLGHRSLPLIKTWLHEPRHKQQRECKRVASRDAQIVIQVNNITDIVKVSAIPTHRQVQDSDDVIHGPIYYDRSLNSTASSIAI
ncbi:hypothetical protein CBL_04544 [Carabus blaptoides fortunei]